MIREEAKGYLMNISYQLGNMSVIYLSDKDGEKMREAIGALEQEPKWIPVSERLPEKDGEYLVTVKSTFKNTRNYIKHCHFARNLYLVDEYDFADKTGVAGFYEYDSEYGYYEMTEVIAWMPFLPEPYKSDRERRE